MLLLCGPGVCPAQQMLAPSSGSNSSLSKTFTSPAVVCSLEFVQQGGRQWGALQPSPSSRLWSPAAWN